MSSTFTEDAPGAPGSSLFKALEAAAPPVVARTALLDAIPWNNAGLIPVVVQQHDSGEVLMLAWMNRDALTETLDSGRAVYWSRSRGAIWRKGEQSGNTQRVLGARLDCDGDALLLRVDQTGAACHSGRRSCFYVPLDQTLVEITDPQIQDPAELYGVSPDSDGADP